MPTWIILIFGSAIFSLAGTSAAKYWIRNPRPIFFVIILFAYTMASLLWIFALKRERVAIAEALWGTLILILTVALGIVVFHEKISAQETIGVILAVMATLLLTIKL